MIYFTINDYDKHLHGVAKKSLGAYNPEDLLDDSPKHMEIRGTGGGSKVYVEVVIPDKCEFCTYMKVKDYVKMSQDPLFVDGKYKGQAKLIKRGTEVFVTINLDD